MNASRIANAIAQIEKRRSKSLAAFFYAENVPIPRDRSAELLANPALSTVPDITGMLTHENYHVRKKATEALGERRDVAAIPALIEALGDTEDHPFPHTDQAPYTVSQGSVSRHASYALKQLGSPAVPALTEALKHKNEDVRSGVAFILAEIMGVSALPLLEEALRGKYGAPLPAAASALGNLGEVSAVPTLVAALKNENEKVRIFAARALGQMRESSAVPALISLLNDPHPAVVLAASYTLEAFKDPSILPRITALLQHTDETVRAKAVHIVGKYDDPDTISALLDSLQNKSERIRSIAAHSLRQTADRSAIPAPPQKKLTFRNRLMRYWKHMLRR